MKKGILGSEFKILLYILIGAAYLISRLYKNEVKKTVDRRHHPKPVSQRTSDEIFRELRKTLNLPDNTDPEADSNYPAPPVQETKSKAAFKTLNRIPMRPALKSQSSIRKQHEVKAQSNDMEEQVSPVDFDLRKAVIYSEILKRPQY